MTTQLQILQNIHAITGVDNCTQQMETGLRVQELCHNYVLEFLLGLITIEGPRYDYEYRPFSRIDSVKVIMGEGIVVDSVQLWFDATRGYGGDRYRPTIAQPYTIRGDTLIVTPYIHYSDFGGGFVAGDGSEYGHTTRIHYKVSCVAADKRDTMRQIAYWSSPTCESFTTKSSAIQSYVIDKPDIDLTNVGAITKNAIEKVVTWDVNIRNASVTENSENTFLGFSSSTGLIQVDSVRDLSTGNLLKDTTNGIYAVGTVNLGGANTDFRVYATYDICERDTIYALTGWNCTGYPTDVASYPCQLDTTNLILVPLHPELQIINTERPMGAIALCDTFKYEFEVTQVDPAASYDNVFRINMPANSGFKTDSTYVEFPSGSGTKIYVPFQSIGGGSFGFNLDTIVTYLGTNGLRPVAEAPNNTYRVGFQAYAACGFVSGDVFQGQADGNEACGRAITTVFDNSAVNVDNAAAAGTRIYIPRIDSVGVNGCGTPTNTKLSLFNFSGGPVTTVNDRFYLVLPLGVSYETGSAAFSNNAFTPTEPVVNTTAIPGRERLEWTVAAGIATNDSSIWTINIEADKAVVSCNTLEFEAQTLTLYPDTCGAMICTVGKLSRSTTEPMAISKAIINLMTGSSIEIRRDTNEPSTSYDTLITSITYNNTGTINSEKVNLYYFSDANMNGKWDAGEAIVARDSFTGLAPSYKSRYEQNLYTAPLE